MKKKVENKNEKSESKTPKKPTKAASTAKKRTKKESSDAPKENPEATSESSAPAQESKPKQTRNEKGQFVKGSHSTGRPRGAKGRYTNARDALKDQIMPFVNNLGELIIAIKDPGDRADAIAKFLPFFLPKYSSTSITAEVDRPIAEEERLLELDKQYKARETQICIKTLTIVDNDKPKEGESAVPSIPDADLGR